MDGEAQAHVSKVKVKSCSKTPSTHGLNTTLEPEYLRTAKYRCNEIITTQSSFDESKHTVNSTLTM
jgi:hypothetical protein